MVGNITFIYKGFYAAVLINEISNYSIFLKSKFNLEVSEENKKVPNICWAPKLYKNPSKARFLIILPQYSNKSLSKVVASLLKTMYRKIATYNSK